LAEEDARVIAAQILLVLDYMSRLNMVHRDLKPENILLNSKKEKDFDIRVADFGYATKIKK
jgi:calcium-dependent protein kinase